MIDAYMESGVFYGRTARLVRAAVGPDFPMILVDPKRQEGPQAWKATGKSLMMINSNHFMNVIK